MIKLKKLITITVLVSMLPRTLMAQGEEKKKNVKISEGQRVSTTEAEPNEESLADMTATSEREAPESMKLPDEQSQYEENEHSGSDSESKSDLDSDLDSGSESKKLESTEDPIYTETKMADTEENPNMSESKNARDEDGVEKTTTESEHKDAETTKDPVCTETTIVDDEENSDISESKNARNEDGVEKTTTESKHKDAETTKDPVCTETAMVDDEENSDMPENRKESTTSTKSDKDDVVAIAASNQEEKEKSANNIYMQGVQCENNMEFCKAIELYKQAAELGNIAAVHKLSEFHLYDANDFYKMCEWCEWASMLFRNVECLKDLNIRYEALPSYATPGSKMSISNQIYECKIEFNALKNKLKSLESNLFIMKDKIKNSPFAWYKNAAKVISTYREALQSENIGISPKSLDDFRKCCEIIKNENPEKVLNWFEMASKSGNADVMCKLAEYYETGKGLKKDDSTKVREWHKKTTNLAQLYEKDVANKNTIAMCKLAFYYKYGKGGVQKDLSKAIELYQEAAALGSTYAMTALACCYIRGEGISQDLEEANTWLQKAAKIDSSVFLGPSLQTTAYSGGSSAMCSLARFYELGFGHPKDKNMARNLYVNASKYDKDPYATYMASNLYEDYFNHTELLRRAAELGNADAIFERCNYKEATKLGHPYAILDFIERSGLDQNGKLKLYKKAAEEGHVHSMVKLVKLGVEPERWAKKAASLGYVEAYNELSRFYSETGNRSLSEKCHEMYLEEENKWREFHSKRDNLSILMSDVEKISLEREIRRNGNSYAMYELGHLYESGYWEYKESNRYINVFKAFKLYAQAANRGNLDAMIKVGVCYRDGKGVRKDTAKAKKWLKLSAESGNIEGMYEYAVFLEEVDLNTEEAIKWYEEVAKVDKNRCAEVMRRLGICYKVKSAKNTNLKNSIEYLQQAADLRDTEAMRQLGIFYEYGEGVDKDLSKAVNLYIQAADEKNAKAMAKLASCYENGNGVPQNLNKSVEWLRKAVALGDSDAMFNLASWYEQGKGGLPQNLIEAAYLLGQAAGNGHVEAMYKLGIMFMNGEGVVQNLELGISWLQRAADEDNIEALHTLASCYEKGHGVPQNDEIIKGLLQKIDTLSEIDEICKSAYRYEYGVGVDQNLVLAASLYLVTLTTLNENMSIMAVKRINKDFFRCYNKILNNRISLETDSYGLDFFENEGYKQFLLH